MPETLLGDPTDIAEFLAQLPFKRKYLSLAATFAAEEVDVEAFNAGAWRSEAGLITAMILDAAYAGVPTLCRPPVFANCHTHTGRLEINFLLPRAMINGHGHLRSFTPFPPQKRYEVFRYVLQEALIKRLELIDPRSPLRTRLFKLPSWMHKEHAEALRAGLDGHSLFRLIDPLIAAAERGEVHGRGDLICALHPLLGDIGYVVHEVSAHCVTIEDTVTRKHLPLGGFCFSDSFRDPQDIHDLRDKNGPLHAERQLRLAKAAATYVGLRNYYADQRASQLDHPPPPLIAELSDISAALRHPLHDRCRRTGNGGPDWRQRVAP
ncbi:hypothetical protein [Paracoccus aestuarii]|uniref:hypothetical protein n=1 Tax=Paracoccus aestuarii TaxID=453842 RepID=UPI0011C3F686|nr:hypothetical protein [Paracoccus aestuarii]WCR00538.1 hypothetical protein JHW48_07800 [Paracoccus aestuarii]